MRLSMHHALVGPALSLAALLLSSAATMADTLVARADLSAATVYNGQAEMTRRATLSLPEGTHRLHLALPDARGAILPEIAAIDGVRFGPISLQHDIAIDEGALDTQAQAEARQALTAAQDALESVEDEIALASIAAQVADLQITNLQALANDPSATPSAGDDLATHLATIGAELARAATARQEARISLRVLQTQQDAARAEVAAAQDRLNALHPFADRISVLALDVTAEAAADVEVIVHHIANGVYWEPRYDMALATESGEITLERSIELMVDQPEIWRNVAVTFSTELLDRALAPTLPRSTPARIRTPMPIRPAAEREGMGMADLAITAEVMPAPMVVAQDRAQMNIEGLSVSYSYTDPVSVGTTGRVLLPFDSLALEAELSRLAVPRLNTTAFLMAQFDNDTGEPILPGPAIVTRDGALIGETYLPLIPAGAQEDMAFGALDHLRLSWHDLSRDEGDTGIFVQSNTQTRALRFSVENTGSTPEEVTILYALPFAEQEDLSVDITLSQAPDTTAWDDLRGVHMWQSTVPSGGTETIDVTVDFNWPDGQTLEWWP